MLISEDTGSEIKLILSVNPIKPQLSGIGRYTWELATRLKSFAGLRDLRYFDNGKWISDLDVLRRQSALRLNVREKLVRNKVIMNVYGALAPYILQARLAKYSDHIFHGPNFYLPKFSGRSVVTIHDLSVIRFPQYHPAERVSFMERQIHHSLKQADFLITDSDFTRQECIDYFRWPSDRIRSVPLGVSEKFSPMVPAQTESLLRVHNLKHGEYCLCVATVEPRKNLISLIDAYSRLPLSLRGRHPLVLAGGKGWRSEQIHDRIKLAQSEGWVKYLGFVEEETLPALYAGARGFAFPSYYEGFGLPVLEAMACGIPTLISDQSSLPEVAQGAALVVKPDDIVGLSDALRCLMENDAWRSSAANRSLEIARQYTWQKTAERTAEVYASVTAL